MSVLSIYSQDDKYKLPLRFEWQNRFNFSIKQVQLTGQLIRDNSSLFLEKSDLIIVNTLLHNLHHLPEEKEKRIMKYEAVLNNYKIQLNIFFKRVSICDCI